MSPLAKLKIVWHFIVKLGKYTAVIATKLLLVVTILLLFFAFAYTTDRKGNFSWPREFGRIGIFEQLAK